MSLAAQAKILRALQNGEIVPVGSDATLRVDVRLIAATNKNLKEEVAQGRFREDLYYRLSVVELYNPPLRDRTEDIPLLIQHFAKQIALDYGLAPKAFDSEALELMKNYPWPGNIRELRNVVERLVILGGSTIQKFDLPLEICANAQRAIRASVDRQDGAFPTWDEFKRESETAFLTRVLKHAGGNMAEAARILAVERSTVHKWIKSLGIEKESFLSQGD